MQVAFSSNDTVEGSIYNHMQGFLYLLMQKQKVTMYAVLGVEIILGVECIGLGDDCVGGN